MTPRGWSPGAGKESLIGCLIWGGFLTSIFGVLATVLLYGAGLVRLSYSTGQRAPDVGILVFRGIGPALVLVGLAAALVGLAWGLRESKKLGSKTGRVVEYPDCQIVMRFAYRDGAILTEPWQWEDDPSVERYVKVRLPDGRVREFRTSPEVHAGCGDGMRGTASVDGLWLGRFVPHIGGEKPKLDPFVNRRDLF
ncbi:MAG: hypothetical protein SNJ74_09025 [Fimbriimonadaceae bacterium]